MSNPEHANIRLHEDAAYFREAINFTAAQTAFSAALIEKDYFCTVLLSHLAGGQQVFKGGTCLAKVHADFYRLSEDLDFAIPMPLTSSRSERAGQAAQWKHFFAELPRAIPCFQITEPLRGANSSTQYNGALGYTSLLSRRPESIQVEVSLREPLLTPAILGKARTILLDPISARPLVPPVAMQCLSRMEAMAEKFRAAMTRREVAIRDFFDIDYAVRKLAVQPGDKTLVKLVRQKIAVPGNETVRVGSDRLAQLGGQVNARLKPVLRQKDFDEFNLDRAFQTVVEMARAVE